MVRIVDNVADLRAVYGWNKHRLKLLDRLDEVLDYLRDHGQKFDEMAVYGSFVTDKAVPKDIDVSFLTAKDSDGRRLLTLTLQEHMELSTIKRADVDLIAFPSVKLYEDSVRWASQPPGNVVRIKSFGPIQRPMRRPKSKVKWVTETIGPRVRVTKYRRRR